MGNDGSVCAVRQATAVYLLSIFGQELQCRRVNTKMLTRWRVVGVKHVAQVAAAGSAADFGAGHAGAVVGHEFDGVAAGDFRKAGPAD